MNSKGKAIAIAVVTERLVHYFYIRNKDNHIVSLVGWVMNAQDDLSYATATCNPNTIIKMIRRKDLGPNIFERQRSRDTFSRQRAHDVVNKKLRKGNSVRGIPRIHNQPISKILIDLSETHRLERVREAAKATLGKFADRAQ
jgi:hypothetical protein